VQDSNSVTSEKYVSYREIVCQSMNFHINDSLVVILLMDLKLMHWFLVTADTCNTAIMPCEI
jgi:hypothetical protein